MAEDEFLASLIGMTTSQVTVVIERGPVTLFAESVFDDDPAYRDAEAAKAAGFDAIPAPPTFPMAMPGWGAFKELQPLDVEIGGEMSAIIDKLKERGGLILQGEQSFHYYRPIVVGDVLTGTSTIVDAYAKESKGHVMSFVIDETLWRDASTGEPVCSASFNVIHRL